MKILPYQLVLQFPADTLKDFDALIALEDLLIAGIEDDETVVDGHDSGSGESNIFIHTSDPDLAFTRAHSLLLKQGAPPNGFRAAYRKIDADSYTVLWPEGQTEFAVT